MTGAIHSLRVVFLLGLGVTPLCLAAQTTGATGQNSDDVLPPLVTPQADQIDTARLLVPNSAEVIYDVQSALAPAKYQRGVVGEWQYVLFPDGSAVVRRENAPRQAKITVSCEISVACIIRDAQKKITKVPAIGAPRPEIPQVVDGLTLARFVAESVLAGTGTPPPVVKTVVKKEAIKEAITEKPPIPSGLRETETQPLVVEEEKIEKAAPKVVIEKDKAAEALPAKTTKNTSEKKPVRVVFEPKKSAKNTAPLRTKKMPAKRATPVFRHPKSAIHKIVGKDSKPNQPQPSVEVQEKKPRLSFGKKYKLACSISGTGSLTYIDANDQQLRSGKPRVSLGCYAKLNKRLSGRVALVRYVHPERQAPWDPDFTYAFSYKASEKITLSYSNYSARFQGEGESFSNSLTTGFLRGSYKLPEIKLPYEKKAKCLASIRIPNPKLSSARLYCGVALTDKLSIAATAHAYFSGMQESYQPDFTYTATYKVTKDLNLTYSNYGNNRFPWNKSSSEGRGILGGSVTVSYKF